MKMRTDELILIAGTEGGGIALWGRYGPDGWRFRLSRSEARRGFVAEETRADGEWISGWPSALDELDRHAWHRLPGGVVKREFRDLVWQAVERRINADRDIPAHRATHLTDRWRDRCAVASQDVSLDP